MEKLGERIPRCWVSNFRGCDQSRMEARQISYPLLLLPSLRHFYDDFPVNRNLPRLELFLLLLLLLLFPSTLKPFVTRCICFA